MIKVKMLSGLVFKNNKTLHPRQVIELQKDIAEMYISKNLAVLVEEKIEPKQTKEEKIIETVENIETVEETPKKKTTRRPKKLKVEV